jgi:guanylate kinase
MSTNRDKLNNFKLKHNDDLKKYLSKINMVCLVAPTGVGKDALINWLVNADKNKFSPVKVFSNRPPRPDETEDNLFFLPPGEAGYKKVLESIDGNNLVNLALNPGNDNFYGTFRESFEPNRINIMPTLASSLPEIAEIPFASLKIISISCSYADWTTRTKSRLNNPDFAGRVKEAKLSLSNSLNTAERTWVLNQNLDVAGKELMEYLINGTEIESSERAKQQAKIMLDKLNREENLPK